MPVSMAGSRGGVIRRTQEARQSNFIENLLTGHVSVNDLHQQFAAESCPKSVTLVVNNSCNLSCGHCYLQVKELTASALTETEWKSLIDSVANIDPELVCLSGKEVFLGNRGARLLSYLREAKERTDASYRIGLITNGTLVHKHKESILQAQPNYFDISLDGIEADHDAVRGQGAFAQALPNVEWAAQTFDENFFVTLTVQKQNVDRLREAVQFLNQRGLQNIVCGFYLPLSYTTPHLALSDSDVDKVLDQLSDLGDVPLEGPLNILFDLDITNLQSLKAFLRSKWFSLEDVQQDSNGEYFIEHWLNNNLRLEFRFAPFPTGIWKSMRITPEGNYLAAEDTIDTTKYAERAIGNVRDFNYDFSALHAHALASDRFREIVQEYYDEVLPELQAAFCRNSPLETAAYFGEAVTQTTTVSLSA